MVVAAERHLIIVSPATCAFRSVDALGLTHALVSVVWSAGVLRSAIRYGAVRAKRVPAMAATPFKQ
jgi:hypothetical protein